MVENEKKNQL